MPLPASAIRRSLLVLASVAAASGCGLNAHVRPLPKGTVAIEAAVGGPAVRLSGVPVPLLLSTVGARVGLVDRLDVSVHTHITTLAVFKLFGLDVGLGWLIFEQHGVLPAVDVSARFYVFTDFVQAQSAAEVGTSLSWQVTDWLLPYLTFSVYVDALAGLVHVAPGLGCELRIGRFTLLPELRWYAPETSARGSAVEWLSPFKQGAVGLVLGARFDARR